MLNNNKMFDKLFKFPIIMADRSDVSDYKPDIPYTVGYAEVPYTEFRFILDRWLPSQESRDKADEGEFEACQADFGTCGEFTIPWTKEKFKEKLRKFVELQPPNPEIMVLTREQIKEWLQQPENEDGKEG